MEKKYYSEAAMAIHESARDLFEVGAICETEMKDFDNRCLVHEPETEYESEKTSEMAHITA